MDSYMIVSLTDEMNHMQTLNETGAFLWDELSTDTDETKLLARLTEEYDIDPDTAKSDIDNFIKKLRAANLLDD